jgi:hypothetical protein
MATARHPAREDPDLVRGGSGLGQKPVEDGPGRAHDHQPGQQPDLGPELVGLGRHEQDARDRHEDAEDDPPDAPGRRRLRVGDHEEQEDEDLGRGDDDPEVVGAADRLECPPCGHAVSGRGERPETERQRHPERRGQAEEQEPAGDQQPAADDHDVRDNQPDVERSPPEVERLHAGAAEDDEGEHQPDVRRVEDVRAAVADDVLGQERESRHAGEDVPGVRIPGLVGWRPDDPQDQRDAAPGQHRAGRPHERPALPEGQDDLDDRAGQDGSEDLGDGDEEVQAQLAEDVDRDDDRRDVQARIANVRQNQRVGAAADGQRPGGHRRRPATATA